MNFSSKKRSHVIQQLRNDEFDLLVIGGGITGAGIALDAVTRGMKVALIEMQDFASGTSSRSTKLVHGGLRYLKQFEINTVAKIGKERAIVYENGPHVTTPEWMLLPFHKGGTFGKLTTNLGLRLYDFLAGVKKKERRKILSAEETIKREPLIKKEGLKGGGYYVEYRTDDARLTIEVMKAAAENGAVALNYMKAEEFIYNEKKVCGIVARDLLTGETIEIKAVKVVNAAGPWVDQVRKKDYSINNKKLRLTKGVHIVFDQSHFPLRQAVYFDTPDKRMVFAIPREGKTYVGTTDTFYGESQDIANPKPLKEDINYILEAIKFMFPEVQLTEEHVESSWAGVRPLIYQEGKDPSEISRKDEIWEGDSSLITIAGGKLTGYREMAETVVDLVAKRIQEESNRSFLPCKTRHVKISGGEVNGSHNLPFFIKQKSNEASEYGLTKEEGEKLAAKYGSNVDCLFTLAKKYPGKEESFGLTPAIYAQILYALEEEMTVKPADFFIRRTGALLFDLEWVKQWKKPVIQFMAKEFGWNEKTIKAYEEELEKEIKDAVIPIDRQE
ncbi:homodimeric glycerol 3-phosphate dehydrogenase (quinone) [Bacillus oleivorans]|uniref:Glycerol-3-phosphate dehydrogenase n=1 Tax=Bacillus oleivorans TaxID=1448271 RepID=A0A285CL69_9BACI|nr:glycerol-3-phosphate dehydrogenase/oxidase [Bacillus oleivorans]SNX68302.1 homodimeric glycerol 3-phosphate dehydrogenase (quinone) [Bacillus oleivorans]